MKARSLVVDQLLEASIVGSWSKVGYEVRRRVAHWEPHSLLRGRTVLITGATSGLGYECALIMAERGAQVRFVARDEARARQAQRAIQRATSNDDVEFVVGDVASLASVREIAEWANERLSVLDALVHNAGAITTQWVVTNEGNETTVASQLLGPFLLTGLVRTLLANAAPGRVITVASGGLYTQRFNLATLEMYGANYDGVRAYARAKRAQLVLSHAWSERVARSETVFSTMHPGWVDTPGLRNSLPGFYSLARPILRTPSQGVDSVVWLASSPEARNAQGLWLDRRRRAEHKVPWTRSRDDAADQDRLWQWCVERTGWGGDLTT